MANHGRAAAEAATFLPGERCPTQTRDAKDAQQGVVTPARPMAVDYDTIVDGCIRGMCLASRVGSVFRMFFRSHGELHQMTKRGPRGDERQLPSPPA